MPSGSVGSSVCRTLSSSESWSTCSILSSWSTCPTTAGGVFGVHVLRRGGHTSQNRLSDDTNSLFFGRPARAGRTLTVKGLSSNGRSSLYDLADALARGANRAGDLGLCEA